ncbi:hypothetical protein AB0L40_05340 [Patulibacter sp. NPDC049589]|uniref:hypothetical protein n=1 Tax=Patulibacter sp. NPDC049589 TaxID=3154731 RepID=UPI0034264D0A
MDRRRRQFDTDVRRMAGVLAVLDDRPRPGSVTLRVVAGHGDRIRSAAAAIAPPGLDLYVLEDDLVTSVPELPPSDATPSQVVAAENRRRAAAARDAATPGDALRCSYVFCRHRTAPAGFGLRPGDRCRQKIGVTNGGLSCPGHYEHVPSARRRWWRRAR